jgi:hypothetical protein
VSARKVIRAYHRLDPLLLPCNMAQGRIIGSDDSAFLRLGGLIQQRHLGASGDLNIVDRRETCQADHCGRWIWVQSLGFD